MKTLLFLNGSEGWQTGIEDGFNYLQSQGVVTDLKWFYFEEFAKKTSSKRCMLKMIEIANEILPDLIVFFHIGKFSIKKDFLNELKGLASKPILVYDEGDMYGTWAKPITPSMKVLIKGTDIVSIRGFGKFYSSIARLNKNIIYTPNHVDIARFYKQNVSLISRKYPITFIGNRVKPIILSTIRRMPGARGREKFVFELGKVFPKSFKLFGNGWRNFLGNQGPIDFQKQIEIIQESLITVDYEHYPNIPYFFSNRLPIALFSGTIYVCHYHQGFENIFRNCDFIFFFKSNNEAISIIKFLQSLDTNEINERSKRARIFALENYTPEVVWKNFYENILKLN